MGGIETALIYTCDRDEEITRGRDREAVRMQGSGRKRKESESGQGGTSVMRPNSTLACEKAQNGDEG